MEKFFAIILLLLGVGVQAQDVAKVRTYGGAYNDFGSQVIETSDGGYAIIGTTGSFGSGQSNMYFLKLNIELEKEWSHVYGGHNLEWGQSLVETSDGFLLLGFTNSFGAGGYDIYLVKTDLNGNFQWQQTYGGTDWDFGYKILAANDGYYIAGESWSFSNGGTDGYLLHINESGDELWSQNFGGTENDWLSDLFIAANGVIAVGTNSSVSEKSKVYLIEIDGENNTTEYTIGTDDLWHEGNAGLYHSNDHYFITGATESDDYSDFAFFRLDTDFNVLPIDINPHGGSLKDVAYSITEISSGEITMVGESNSFAGSIGALLLRVTTFGTFITAPTFGGSTTDIARNVIVNSNHQLMFVGESSSFGAGNFDVYLVQLETDLVEQNYILDEVFTMDSLLTSIEEVSIASAPALLYPNPTRGQVFVSGDESWQIIRFFDLKGKMVFQADLSSGNREINLPNLKSGVYIAELSNNNYTSRQRLMIY